LEVSHRGHADIVVPDAGNPQSPNRPLQPSFDFDNLSVFEIRTVNNDQSRFYIALCKANYSHRIFVNIHRIRAGTTARFQIVATFTANPATINPSQVHFFPGTIPNIDIVTQGAISRPWLKRQL
jgi:hypothetical protein